MPVMSRVGHAALMTALSDRYHILRVALSSRDLLSTSEGAGRRAHWSHPEAVCGTIGSALQIRLAVADFRAALKEIEGLR
jgi:hypothetical protein